MKTVTEWLRERILSRVPTDPPEGQERGKVKTVGEILDGVGSEFLELMMNRMVQGHFRYGPLKTPGGTTTDNVKDIRRRLNLYEKTGNAEHLVDIANLCLVEFTKPSHPDAHFKSQDDAGHAKAVR